MTESATQKAVAACAATEAVTFFPENPPPIGSRPWLTCFAPAGPLWSRFLFTALDKGTLTVRQIQEDIRQNLVRPSVLYQVEKRAEDPFRLPAEAMKMDSTFLPPELKVSEEQLKFLRRDNRRLMAVWWIRKCRNRLATALSVPVKTLRQSRSIRHAFKFIETRTYQWGYAFSSLRRRFLEAKSSRPVTPEYDWVFILKRKTAERRIEDACDRISFGLSGKHCVYFAANAVTLPRAKVYCFPDASFFTKCFQKIPSLWEAKTIVFYDPAALKGAPERKDILYALTRASKVESDILESADNGTGKNSLGALLAEACP